jgi:methionyl-tRNA formyltransferase
MISHNESFNDSHVMLDAKDWADFIVSYRYTHLIPRGVLAWLPHRVINIHCGRFEYARGVRPVFFSLCKRVPLGITIHEVDEYWDHGPVLSSALIAAELNADMTLEEVWTLVNHGAVALFRKNWPFIKRGQPVPWTPRTMSRLHTTKEFETVFKKLPNRWHTRLSELMHFIEGR